MEDFHVGPYMTAVGAGEMLTEIRLRVRPGAGSAHEKVERRAGDWAIAAASAAVWMEGGTFADVGIALSAVGLTTIHLTRAPRSCCGPGAVVGPVQQAAAIASEDCSPMADGRGPVDYKRHLAGVLTGRALRRATARALQRGGLSMDVSMTVNGERVTHDVEPRMLLVHFLRETLDLTGTHWGCDTSNCGACVVLMDGQAREVVHDARRDVRGPRDPHRRVARGRRRARPGAAGLPRAARAPVRLLHARDDDDRPGAAGREPQPHRRGDPHGDLGRHLPLHRLQEHRRGGARGPRATQEV